MKITFQFTWVAVRASLAFAALLLATVILCTLCVWANDIFFDFTFNIDTIEWDTILQDMLKRLPFFGTVVEQLLDWMSVTEISPSSGIGISSLFVALSSSIVLLVCIEILLYLNKLLCDVFALNNILSCCMNFIACIFGVILAFVANSLVENCFEHLPTILGYILLIPMYCVPAMILALIFPKRGTVEKSMFHWLAELLLDTLLLLMIYFCVICFHLFSYIDVLSPAGQCGVVVGSILSILGITLLSAMKFGGISFADMAK